MSVLFKIQVRKRFYQYRVRFNATDIYKLKLWLRWGFSRIIKFIQILWYDWVNPFGVIISAININETEITKWFKFLSKLKCSFLCFTLTYCHHSSLMCPIKLKLKNKIEISPKLIREIVILSLYGGLSPLLYSYSIRMQSFSIHPIKNGFPLCRISDYNRFYRVVYVWGLGTITKSYPFIW